MVRGKKNKLVRNLKLEIEYDGTNYCGWQVQNRPRSTAHGPQKQSIQGIIEKTLQKILQERVYLIGSGRTDAGVHALAQVANFKTHSAISIEKLQKALNGLLPDDISIHKVEEERLDFHSRFDAVSKIYRYTILNQAYPCALLRNRVFFYPYLLNIALMRAEARYLLGRHDFAAFCARRNSAKNTVRTIQHVSIKAPTYFRRRRTRLRRDLLPTTYLQSDSSLIEIEIEANGFLYNMARAIVGTLIDIGRGRFSQGTIRKLLESRARTLAGPTASAKGLCLMKVKY